MASCQNRKIGNCSDYSPNRLLQEKAPETFPRSFTIPGSSTLCVGRGGRRQYLWQPRGSGVAPEKQTVSLDCGCVCRTGMAQRAVGS